MKKYLLLLILILIFSVSFIIGDAQNPKHWINTWTEIEELGNNKFGATIYTGHRVFLDKTDGQYKKHKLTDERPEKEYITIQSTKCCIEIHPYFSKYFDIQHKEIRLHEERWVVQRLFKEPDKWRDVGAYNPIINIEKYSELAGDVVKVTVTYDTDYGELVVEYFQRDGNALKHNVYFKNTSGGTETFRVLQKWAGIVGTKCNGRYFPSDIEGSYLVFHDEGTSQKNFNIAENLYSMVFNPDGSEKIDQCLQRPISIETHAQGMKTDFIYGNWTLAQDERLEIDPDTATLDDPVENGYAYYYEWLSSYHRQTTSTKINMSMYYSENDPGKKAYQRGYVEWNVSGIGDGAIITDTVFKYHGDNNYVDAHIHEMVGARPSTSTDQQVYNEVGEGTVYAAPAGFPVEGTNQSVDLGASADSDLESQLSVGWFAIGLQSDNETINQFGIFTKIYSDRYATPTPPPTLYVEGTGFLLPVNVIFFSTPF